jgi:chromosome segregation ATPase
LSIFYSVHDFTSCFDNVSHIYICDLFQMPVLWKPRYTAVEAGDHAASAAAATAHASLEALKARQAELKLRELKRQLHEERKRNAASAAIARDSALASVTALASTVTELKRESVEQRTAVRAKDATIVALRARVGELEAQVSALTAEREELVAMVAQLQGELTTARALISTLMTERDAAAQQLAETSVRLIAAESRATAFEQRCAEVSAARERAAAAADRRAATLDTAAEGLSLRRKLLMRAVCDWRCDDDFAALPLPQQQQQKHKHQQHWQQGSKLKALRSLQLRANKDSVAADKRAREHARESITILLVRAVYTFLHSVEARLPWMTLRTHTRARTVLHFWFLSLLLFFPFFSRNA